MSDAQWFIVADSADLWEGEVFDVEVSGQLIMIAHLLGGDLRAYQGLCPHQEIPMAAGTFDPETSQLTCAGHAWVFDLRTGQGVNPVGCQLFSYPIRQVGTTIQVAVAKGRNRHYCRGHVEPAAAGTHGDYDIGLP
jgi:toluene monooxygenase system ferredoxin subunit